MELAPTDTILHCRIWYLGLVLRQGLVALLVGLLAGLLSVAQLSPSLSVVVGGVVARGTIAWDAWATRARLRRGIEVYIHNTTYLKAM
jgi:hypothetical protein